MWPFQHFFLPVCREFSNLVLTSGFFPTCSDLEFSKFSFYRFLVVVIWPLLFNLHSFGGLFPRFIKYPSIERSILCTEYPSNDWRICESDSPEHGNVAFLCSFQCFIRRASCALQYCVFDPFFGHRWLRRLKRAVDDRYDVIVIGNPHPCWFPRLPTGHRLDTISHLFWLGGGTSSTTCHPLSFGSTLISSCPWQFGNNLTLDSALSLNVPLNTQSPPFINDFPATTFSSAHWLTISHSAPPTSALFLVAPEITLNNLKSLHPLLFDYFPNILTILTPPSNCWNFEMGSLTFCKQLVTFRRQCGSRMWPPVFFHVFLFDMII